MNPSDQLECRRATLRRPRRRRAARPAVVADAGLEVAKVVISREMRNGGDTFAEEATVRAQAPPIERLAAFTGRSV